MILSPYTGIAVALDPPVITRIEAQEDPDGENLTITLAWDPVDQATLYRILEYVDGDWTTRNFSSSDTSETFTYALPNPHRTTTFSYKVISGVYSQGDLYLGPGTWAELTYPPYLFRIPPIYEIDLWGDPWQMGWLEELWRAYSEPVAWPLELAPDSPGFAMFVRRLRLGVSLTAMEEQMVRSLGQDGQAILNTALENSPDQRTAELLRIRLYRQQNQQSLPSGMAGSDDEESLTTSGLLRLLREPGLITVPAGTLTVTRTPTPSSRPTLLIKDPLHIPVINVTPTPPRLPLPIRR